MNDNFQQKLIQAVKDAGQEIVDKAEGFVGPNNLLSYMTITIRFDPEISMFCPTIDVNKTYLCERARDRLYAGKANDLEVGEEHD